LLALSVPAFAQSQPSTSPAQHPGAAPQQKPAMPPDKPAPPPQDTTANPEVSGQPASPKTPDRAAAYYHYTLAHMYEEMVAFGRTEFATQAIEEYRKAIEADPSSEALNAGLAELYAKTGRIRDAVLEAQEILKRDPNNVEARKLLGRIYLRSLGDMSAGTQSQQMLKLAIEQYEEISRLEPNNVEHYQLLGRLYKLNGDIAKAEAAFKKAVEMRPGSEEAVALLAFLYNEIGDTTRAVEVINRIPEQDRTAKIYSVLGFTYEQQKKYDEAIAAYKKAVEMDNENLDAQRGLAQNLLNDNQLTAALSQYKSIADADPQDAQAYMRIADIYRRQGKFEQAMAALDKAETLVQDSIEIPYHRSILLEAQGRWEEAATLLQGLLTKTERAAGSYATGEKNNRGVFLERLGNVYREMGKSQLAVDTFRKMTELGDESASRGYQQIVETYRDAKQWPEATAAAKEGTLKLPEDRGLKQMYAAQLADSGHPDDAIAQLQAMLKGSQEDRETYVALAQVNSRLRRWKEAEEAIKQADKLSKTQEEKDFVAFIAGSIYERQKKYDQAEEMFRRVLANSPDNAVALNYLGYMLADRGTRLEEALRMIHQAVQLDPQNGAYLDSLGWAYFRLGKYEQAEESLRKAVERVPNDATIHDHLGDLYHKTGRLKLAVAHWERAMQEWNKSVEAEREPAEMAKVQKKLDSAKVKLAKQNKQQ
jgi:tetratricopeptide (TPR) repeat protein